MRGNYRTVGHGKSSNHNAGTVPEKTLIFFTCAGGLSLDQDMEGQEKDPDYPSKFCGRFIHMDRIYYTNLI
jgi:hypothetical protein